MAETDTAMLVFTALERVKDNLVLVEALFFVGRAIEEVRRIQGMSVEEALQLCNNTSAVLALNYPVRQDRLYEYAGMIAVGISFCTSISIVLGSILTGKKLLRTPLRSTSPMSTTPPSMSTISTEMICGKWLALLLRNRAPHNLYLDTTNP